MVTHLQLVDRIWRPEADLLYEKKDPVFIKMHGTGDYLIRARFKENGFPIWTAEGSVKPGLVCFVKTEIPKDWIYFQVDRLSMHGDYAIVSPVSGTVGDLAEFYSRLRQGRPSIYARASV